MDLNGAIAPAKFSIIPAFPDDVNSETFLTKDLKVCTPLGTVAVDETIDLVPVVL